MDLELKGDVAVVTGGGRGIGRAICEALAREGCKLAVWDRDLPEAQAVADAIKASGGEAIAVSGDVSQRLDVKRVVDEVLKAFGAIHVLVNNAGFSRDAPLLDITDADWDAIINTCLKGVFLCTQAVAPTMMTQRYGRIINIASRAHLGGEPNKSSYSAAKGGVVSFTKALSLELAPHEITVNAVAPGFVLTDRLAALPHFRDIENRALQTRPVKTHGTAVDQARGVIFLASRGSGYITGETLYITGGRYG